MWGCKMISTTPRKDKRRRVRAVRELRARQRERLERQIAESFSVNADSDRQLIDDFKHVDANSIFDAQQM